MIKCPHCGSSEDLIAVEIPGQPRVYGCGDCGTYWKPSREEAAREVLRRIEVPVAKRVEGEFKVLEETGNKIVFQFGEFLGVLEKVQKEFGTLILDGEKKALTPIIRFQYFDQLFGAKGRPLRQIIRDRDDFLNFVVALQRIGAELTVSGREEPREAPSTDEEEVIGQLEFKGGILEEEDLVYEPLGHGLYVWKYGENRGISKLEPIYHRDEKGRTMKTPYLWKLKVNDHEYYFKKEKHSVIKSFFGELPFRIPDQQFLEKWINGEVKSKTSQDLFKDVEVYVKIMLDLEEAYYSKAVAIYVFQSWLRNFLRVLFNVDVAGAFGVAKTTCLEAVNEVCYHSLLGTASAAGIARMNDKYALSWCLDEFDKQRSWLSEHFIRVGYRAGSQVFRINPKTGREEIFNPFGPKIISYHEALEKALSQRSLSHIKMTKSLDYKLPIINQYRSVYSSPLCSNLFIWYMDRAVSLKRKHMEENVELEKFMDEMVSEVSENAEKTDSSYPFMETHTRVCNSKNREVLVKNSTSSTSSGTNNEEVRRIREAFYKKATEKLSPDEKSLIQRLTGRSCELCYIAIVISRMLGINIIKDLTETLEMKEAEEEEEELDVDMIVKEVLADMSSRDMVQQKEVYQEAKKRVKDAYNESLSTQAFKRVLRDVGFRERKTIMRRKEGRVLRFTDLIRHKLPRREIPEGAPQAFTVTVLGKCDECGEHRQLTHHVIQDGKKLNLCRECAEAYGR